MDIHVCATIFLPKCWHKNGKDIPVFRNCRILLKNRSRALKSSCLVLFILIQRVFSFQSCNKNLVVFAFLPKQKKKKQKQIHNEN